MIDIKELSFSYTEKPFIDNISFSVKTGEIFGFLGPSGAGKSTLQKILTGILPSYKGSVVIGGTEVRKHKNSFYENIGIDFEFPALYEKLTARQNMEFFSSLYSGKSRDIDELLESVELKNHADKRVDQYSKGMKSRLSFIKALVHDPDILFLDEPTSGLDPNNSRLMKDMILKEKERGKTIIITTHNMQDAAELCDRVAFIVNGKVSALDSPHNLIRSKGAKKVFYTYMKGNEEIKAECQLSEMRNDKILLDLINTNKIITIHSGESTLGDIFMEVTGRTLV